MTTNKLGAEATLYLWLNQLRANEDLFVQTLDNLFEYMSEEERIEVSKQIEAYVKSRQ